MLNRHHFRVTEDGIDARQTDAAFGDGFIKGGDGDQDPFFQVSDGIVQIALDAFFLASRLVLWILLLAGRLIKQPILGKSINALWIFLTIPLAINNPVALHLPGNAFLIGGQLVEEFPIEMVESHVQAGELTGVADLLFHRRAGFLAIIGGLNGGVGG